MTATECGLVSILLLGFSLGAGCVWLCSRFAKPRHPKCERCLHYDSNGVPDEACKTCVNLSGFVNRDDVLREVQ